MLFRFIDDAIVDINRLASMMTTALAARTRLSLLIIERCQRGEPRALHTRTIARFVNVEPFDNESYARHWFQ